MRLGTVCRSVAAVVLALALAGCAVGTPSGFRSSNCPSEGHQGHETAIMGSECG